MILLCSMRICVYSTNFQDTTGMALAGLCCTVPMLFTAPMAMKLGQKIGKKEASSIGLIGAGVTYFILFILKLENMYLFLAGTVIAYIFLGIFNTLTWA